MKTNRIIHKIFDLSYKDIRHIHDITNDFIMQRNSKIIKGHLGINNGELVFMHQTHGARIVMVHKANDPQLEEFTDGLITTSKNVALSVQTADCVPLLLYNSQHTIISALHCGWRGVMHGIIKNAVKKITDICDDQIYAIIGPSINQESYEVQNDYKVMWIKTHPDSEKFFNACDSVITFDLCGYVQKQLKESNIIIAKHYNENTFTDLNYPSYRRALKRHVVEFKRVLSVIVLTDAE